MDPCVTGYNGIGSKDHHHQFGIGSGPYHPHYNPAPGPTAGNIEKRRDQIFREIDDVSRRFELQQNKEVGNLGHVPLYCIRALDKSSAASEPSEVISTLSGLSDANVKTDQSDLTARYNGLLRVKSWNQERDWKFHYTGIPSTPRSKAPILSKARTISPKLPQRPRPPLRRKLNNTGGQNITTRTTKSTYGWKLVGRMKPVSSFGKSTFPYRYVGPPVYKTPEEDNYPRYILKLWCLEGGVAD